MNKTYNRILNLVVEDQRIKAHGGRVRAAADTDDEKAEELRKKHGVTDDEISGKVTTHRRSGEKLEWGRSGFKKV